jgi:hypothetical protein
MNDTGEDYTARENLWDEAWPATSEEGGKHPDTEPDLLDEEAPFPEVAGTSDTIGSIRDAEPYMAPTDPPVLPGGLEGIHTATGFGVSPEEENYTEPLPRGDEDIHDEALLILQQDALTSQYPLNVVVRNGVIRLRGQVESVADAEHAESLLGQLPGVVDVIDETTLRGGP